MPQTRLLPIPAEHREFTVKVDGSVVPRQHQLLSLTVSSVVNRIASARLVYVDGAAATGQFPLGDSGLMAPGRRIEILAGPANDMVSLFRGLVVRKQVKVRGSSATQLVVDCRHAAMKLAVKRASAGYFDQRDSEIIESILGNSGISARVRATAHPHEQVVQFDVSDWDFILTRARVNGLLIWADGEGLIVQPPSTAGEVVCTLQFGATLLEFDAEIDARTHFESVRSISWDPAQQELLEVDGREPELSGPGTLAAKELAAVAEAGSRELRHAALGAEEARAWANAEWLESRLNKVSGRAKCEGIASVVPGSVVELAGVGEHFNGKVFVTGVRHDYDSGQGWKTHVQFGGASRRPPEELSAPPAGGLLARVAGLQVGVVVSNEDPQGEDRVRVRLPLVLRAAEGVWARISSLDAGAGRGHFYRPEIGDEVIVGFFAEDPRRPVILGMLHSSANPAPFKGSDDNHEKGYVSRAGMRLTFNDDTRVVVLETPKGNRFTLSEADELVTLADQSGNTLTMDGDGITLKSKKAISIEAGTELKLESGTALSAKGGTELKLEGASQAELTSSAITKVKGSMVHIN